MSYQPVLGPYEFATSDENSDCLCGGTYCTPFINNDFIAFQISGDYSCCESLAGCPELTEACMTSQGLTSDLAFTQANVNIEFDGATFAAGEWVLKGNETFAANTKYVICFCLRGHVTNTTIKAKIGSTESTITVNGNGNYCLTVDPAYGAPTAADWGIIVTGGDDSFTAVLECMSVCVYREFSAALQTTEGEGGPDLNRTEGATGNQIFELPLNIPGEIAAGCYQIKLIDNCGDSPTIYYSQCLSFFPNTQCGGQKVLQFKWRNRNDAFGFDYTTDETYYNMIRVQARLKHPTFPDDTEIPVFSNNTNAIINARVQKLWKVVVNDLPEYVHSSIATMRRHSDFQIDGVSFVVADGSYTPSWRKSSELATAEFEAFDQSFDGVSSNC